MRRIRLLLCLVLACAWRAAVADPVLVSTEWLAGHLGSGNLLVVDMAVEPVQYERFHLPGALYLPYAALAARGRDGVSHPLSAEAFATLLGRMGVSPSTHVVVYDDMGGLQASRLFWELERIGHAHVSVLDGGLVAWVREGRLVSADPVRPQPVTYTLPAGAHARANLADRAALDAKGAVILDVRSREEYEGDPRDPRGGHVPGARSWPWDQAVDVEHGFRLAPAAELKGTLADVGVTGPDKAVVTYCRSGHRAAHTYLVLRSLGYQKVRLYAGSMLEYLHDKAAPVTRGAAP